MLCVLLQSLNDVGFVVDVSGSVQMNWVEEQAFVKTIAEKINVSPSGSHVSVATFNHDAELKIKFPDYYDIDDFKSAVDALPYTGGGTRIDLGLDVALNEMFQVANGMRMDVPKVMILITDGHSGGPPLESLDYATKFSDAGIRSVVIGVGNGINRPALLSVVREESDLHLARDFDQLLSKDFIDSITANCSLFKGKPSQQFRIGQYVNLSNFN